MATRKQLEQYLKNPQVRKFLDLIAHTEGTQGNGYRTAFGGGRLSSLSDHPRYSKSFTQKNGKKNTTSAAGRYQFLRGTWDGLARQYGLKDFGPQSQDIGAVALLAQNGALGHILKGDWQGAVKKSGATWASLPSAPKSYSQPTRSWDNVTKFMTGKGAPSQPQQARTFERPQMVDASSVKGFKPPQQTFDRPPMVDASTVKGFKAPTLERPEMVDASSVKGFEPPQLSFERPKMLDASEVEGFVPPKAVEQQVLERPPMVDLTDVEGATEQLSTNNIMPELEPQDWQT